MVHGFAWSLAGLKDDSSLLEKGDHPSALAWMNISHAAIKIEAYKGSEKAKSC